MCCDFRFKDSTCKPREECAKVAKAIKGTSAHSINRKLHSHEAVWQEESFDHVLRSSESLDAKIDYVLQNPVRKGLGQNCKRISVVVAEANGSSGQVT